MNYLEAKKIMGANFIGPEELNKIKKPMGLKNPLMAKIPAIPFTSQLLNKIKRDYLLILGMPKNSANKPLTINELRKTFGYDPKNFQPCFYNQDWYLKEKFASYVTLANQWYLIKKTISPNTLGKQPKDLLKTLNNNISLPSAILTAYAFFAFYFLNNGKKLWVNNFIWCNDTDHNGDQIYVGRYCDPKKINKNGFNIHRYLTINKIYGLAPIITK
ncbi:MAG: hypothetical protein WCV73_00195 [Patescibacteria group bacterium]|jgi:hypothetical protein